MKTYRITVRNNISGKTRFLKITDISFERAVQSSSYLVNHTSEDIIKAVLVS